MLTVFFICLNQKGQKNPPCCAPLSCWANAVLRLRAWLQKFFITLRVSVDLLFGLHKFSFDCWFQDRFWCRWFPKGRRPTSLDWGRMALRTSFWKRDGWLEFLFAVRHTCAVCRTCPLQWILEMNFMFDRRNFQAITPVTIFSRCPWQVCKPCDFCICRRCGLICRWQLLLQSHWHEKRLPVHAVATLHPKARQFLSFAPDDPRWHARRSKSSSRTSWWYQGMMQASRALSERDFDLDLSQNLFPVHLTFSTYITDPNWGWPQLWRKTCVLQMRLAYVGVSSADKLTYNILQPESTSCINQSLSQILLKHVKTSCMPQNQHSLLCQQGCSDIWPCL